MTKLRIRFALLLSTVLLVSFIIPILTLYLLGTAGLVEATYITGSTDARLEGGLIDLPIAIPPATPRLSPLPWSIDRLGEDGELTLFRTDPQTGEQIPIISFDPLTDQWVARIPSGLQRVVITSPVFKSRIDLPAWLALGSLPLIGLLLGIFLSIVMSRSVTQPISQLAAAAHVIGQRDLAYRVQAKGSQELQDLAQSFNRMAEELEHAEINRRNLMADVAHELRTPLAVLDGNLRAILDGIHPLTEEEIAILYEQTHHLSRLVNDLRELSLAEADQLSLNLQVVDLARLVKETVAHFDLLAQEQGIQLTCELDDPLVHPNLDENRIRQVIHNLLSNAIRYTPQGGSVKISARKTPETHAVNISITDTGLGISPEDMPFIFDRFYRNVGTSDIDQGHTGIGLAIAKAIIEAHGGNITARSDGKNQGSTFTIQFPESS